MNIKNSIMKNALNERDASDTNYAQEKKREAAERQAEADKAASEEKLQGFMDREANKSEPTKLIPPTGRIPTPSDRINSPRDVANQAVSNSNAKKEEINQTASPTSIPTKDEVASIASGNASPKIETRIEDITSSFPAAKHDQLEAAVAQKIPDLPAGFSFDKFWTDPMSQLQLLNPMQVAGVVGLVIGGIGMFKMIKNWWRRKKTKNTIASAQPAYQKRAASLNTETYFSLKIDKDNKYSKSAKKFNTIYNSIMTEIDKKGKK